MKIYGIRNSVKEETAKRGSRKAEKETKNLLSLKNNMDNKKKLQNRTVL